MADDNELKGFEPNSWESLDENMIKTEPREGPTI